MDDLAFLRVQIEWGADEALSDEPRNQFAPLMPTVSAVTSASILFPHAARAVDQAAAASNLETLHQALKAFQGCPLRATASSTVGPSGNPAAKLVLIAEAPGPEDDRSGQAFSGTAGDRMDRILNSAGLSRADLLLTCLVPWRPPGGRPPNDAELAQCLPFLHRLLTLVRPRHLVLLGATPLRILTKGEDNLRKARGRWIPVIIPTIDAPIPALSMLAPDLWLSNPKNKQAAWADFLLLKEALASSSVRF